MALEEALLEWHSLSDDEDKEKLKDYEKKEGQAKEEHSRND